ncbi:DUF5703 family protein [Arsenicicoccus piscis]|uniref:Uncharacterized protein n=1 Tax=Arsenicicoccus piscis TaxID=673954 RepID=A0ABQ6HN59_9MICO|nr:DUF5703 family protein [Arsenicicoccus piscis]MCH8629275.1 DUF5703 family protein [Arsenicicoccus piscis]GMA19767.1 hypothetical protein GCM10025862_17880 [Arsenicicoccus piscis]
MAVDYEYKQVTFLPRVSRAEIRRVLTDDAEYGDWELTRMTVYWGGVRRAEVRRRVIRVQRTA